MWITCDTYLRMRAIWHADGMEKPPTERQDEMNEKNKATEAYAEFSGISYERAAQLALEIVNC